ncbi:MAG: hypothetical protein AAFN79_08380 [Pseudomonadota bacterium]
MTGEPDETTTDETTGAAMRDIARDAFFSGGVSLDRMIETFFDKEDER